MNVIEKRKRKMIDIRIIIKVDDHKYKKERVGRWWSQIFVVMKKLDCSN